MTVAPYVVVGIIFLMGVPSLPLGPILPNEERVTITTEVPNAARTPAPSATAAGSAMENTLPTDTMTPLQKLEARVIRNSQTAKAAISYKPQTPVNVPLLHKLLKSDSL